MPIKFNTPQQSNNYHENSTGTAISYADKRHSIWTETDNNVNNIEKSVTMLDINEKPESDGIGTVLGNMLGLNSLINDSDDSTDS